MDRVPSDPPHALPAPSGPPPPGSRTVTTDDGVPLHVEFDGKLEAPLTVVFSHGFTARLVEWEFQRAALRDRRGSCCGTSVATAGRGGRS
jgi:hypothetical protein